MESAPSQAPSNSLPGAGAPPPAPDVEPENPAEPATNPAPVRTERADPSDADPSSDWLKLSSGEWFKGSLNRMREGQVDFTSATAGNLSLAWADVVELRSSRALVFVKFDRTTVTGPSRLSDGELTVLSDRGVEKLVPGDVLSIVPSKRTELSRWAFLASVGLAGRSGNTQSVNYTAYARLSRVDAYNRLVFDYTGAVGVLSGVPNTNKHRGTGTWDLFVSPIFYVTPLSSEAVFDEFQNLALRWTAASGFGARALRLASLTLKTDLAGGFLQNNYVSVLAGPSQTQGAFVRPGLQVTGSITSSINFEVQWQSSIVVTQPAYTFHHGMARLSFAVFEKFTLDWSTIYDRQETTVTGADGVTPKHDDIAISLGFGVDLH
jgi:hypothetical protein